MKIKELIAKTPEISEEKLLEFIEENKHYLRKTTAKNVYSNHLGINNAQAILDEFDLIQEKKSYLTKSQRDDINGFVSLCMVLMVKADGSSSEPTSEN